MTTLVTFWSFDVHLVSKANFKVIGMIARICRQTAMVMLLAWLINKKLAPVHKNLMIELLKP